MAPRILKLGRFNSGERTSGRHWIGGWVDTKAYLDVVEKGEKIPYLTEKQTAIIQLVLTELSRPLT